jgi:transposase-like protein
MKRDGRTLDRQTQEAIRLMAVARVREGESWAEVIAAYGLHRTTIYKWLKAALQPGGRGRGAAVDQSDGTAAQPDANAGTAGVPLDQWP